MTFHCVASSPGGSSACLQAYEIPSGRMDDVELIKAQTYGARHRHDRPALVALGWTGRRIGGRLVALAMARRPRGLDLSTFQVNSGARRFYERHGFVEVEHGDGLPGWYLTPPS